MEPSPTNVLEYGPLTILLDGFAVLIGQRDVQVTLAEFILLKSLAQNPYQVLNRSALLDAIHEATPGSRSQSSDLRLIDRHMTRLRRKLRNAGFDCIQTMRFTGYRFVPLSAECSELPVIDQSLRARLAG